MAFRYMPLLLSDLMITIQSNCIISSYIYVFLRDMKMKYLYSDLKGVATRMKGKFLGISNRWLPGSVTAENSN